MCYHGRGANGISKKAKMQLKKIYIFPDEATSACKTIDPSHPFSNAKKIQLDKQFARYHDILKKLYIYIPFAE